MDIPTLYSLVHPDGQKYHLMLTEESNSRKSGYASSAQACLSLSFKKKVSGIFGADRSAKNGHPFDAISEYSKWESTGIKKGFRDQAEDGVKALESFLSRGVSVHMTHKVEAHRMFLALLTYLVQQMPKLHRIMDAQILRYRCVLGASCDEINWILSSQFTEAVFAGTMRVRLIGSDDFSETGYTRCAVYLWADLQTHRILHD
jgi:hypothetical protein